MLVQKKNMHTLLKVNTYQLKYAMCLTWDLHILGVFVLRN